MDILHKIGVRSASADQVYEALTTLDGLSGWWTSDTTGDAGLGGVVTFRFTGGVVDMEVRELDPAKRVLWAVTSGPDEWLGTTVTWEIREEGDYAIVLFTHGGWREPVEFMHHCSTKWATYLMSMKALLETGDGAPHPRDVEVDNWD
jgi:uncharacterized protein YndB with AHSA1/START domain